MRWHVIALVAAGMAFIIPVKSLYAQDLGQRDWVQFEPDVGTDEKGEDNPMTEGEIDALEEYMSGFTSMRQIIERSGKSFYLGAVVDPRALVSLRECAYNPYDGVNWACEGEGTDCYCRDDPGCDWYIKTHPSEGEVEGEGDACLKDSLTIPFHDFPAFRNLINFDFNYSGPTNGTGQVAINRRMNGPYTYDYADDVLDKLTEAGTTCCWQHLIYGVPPWVVYTKALNNQCPYPCGEGEGYPSTAPCDVATELIKFLETIMGHYESIGNIERYNVANEVVREYVAGKEIALASAVDYDDTSWTLSTPQNLDEDMLGSSFPTRSATINGITASIDVYGIVDDEIVKITSRNGASIAVVRAQAGTSYTSHEAGAVFHTLRELIQCDREPGSFCVPINDSRQHVNIQERYWPFHVLSDIENNRTNDISDIFIVHAFQRARAIDANVTLCYNDIGHEFASLYEKTNHKYEYVKDFVKLLIATGAPLDCVGFQMHLAAWKCLTKENGTLRLNPKQLRGLKQSLWTFQTIAPSVAITEMDVRMGIPNLGCQDYESNWDYQSLDKHLKAGWEDTVWKSCQLKTRRYWQAEVYRAVLDAAFSVANNGSMHSLTFFTIIDKYNWLSRRACEVFPFTPTYDEDKPSLDCSSPCLLGWKAAENEGEEDGECEGESQELSEWSGVYYMKPAYYRVRDAVVDYFGKALSVYDYFGFELMRFVNNGTVILNYNHIYENCSYIGPMESSFVVKNGEGETVACLDYIGHLYLKGSVYDGQNNLTAPVNKKAFIVTNANGDVVSYIDSEGNLKSRGPVIVTGVPHNLENKIGVNDDYIPD